MGKYSSDTDSSSSNRRKKLSVKSYRRSSSRSSSGSHYSSRCRKGKKYKKSRRSRSRERHSKSSRDGSRDRYKRERKRSRSSSRGKSHRGGKSLKRKDRRQHSSSSSASREEITPLPFSKPNFVEVNIPRLSKESENTVESQIERDKAIKEINSLGFSQKPFLSNASEKIAKDEPTVLETPPMKNLTQLPTKIVDGVTSSILHNNLLMENQEDKLNRWVKKLFQIRQRSINGEPLQLA